MFRLTINTDNAVSQDDDDGGAHEVSRILRELAREIDDGLARRAESASLRDYNGNAVGSWRWAR